MQCKALLEAIAEAEEDGPYSSVVIIDTRMGSEKATYLADKVGWVRRGKDLAIYFESVSDEELAKEE